MTRRILIVIVSLVLLAPVGRLLAADELLKRVPAGANALMVINVTALEATPLSQAQGWQKKHEAAFVERPLMLPPEASRIVVASAWNFAGELNVEWQMAVMNLSRSVNCFGSASREPQGARRGLFSSTRSECLAAYKFSRSLGTMS